MSGSVIWRAALIQGMQVVVLALALGSTLPDSFFEDFGWVAGPGTWAACALVTGSLLRLALTPVLAGAAVAGLPSLVTVLLGAHWLGAPVAVGLFGLWCGWLAGRGATHEPGRLAGRGARA